MKTEQVVLNASEYQECLDLAKQAIHWPAERLADLLVRTRGEGRDEGARATILALDETFGAEQNGRRKKE